MGGHWSQRKYLSRLGEIMGRNLNDKISGASNFTYRELVISNTATRKGINNIPGEQEWKHLEALAENVLQPTRDKFGPLRINSGYRSPELNVAIGGSPTSNHCRGEAADIEPWDANTVTLFKMLEWINGNLQFRTIILEYPPDGWLHVDYRDGANKKMLKLKDVNHNYKLVELEYLQRLYG